MDICIIPNTSRKPRDDRRDFFIFKNTWQDTKVNKIGLMDTGKAFCQNSFDS